MKTHNDKTTESGMITVNRKARHDYTVIETIEAGISLLGSEVKSCVAKEVSIAEAYCVVNDGDVNLVHSTIASYTNSSYMNHDKNRARRLLLHKRQIRKLKIDSERKGMTIIPLDMHFSENGKIKVLIGICKGKNQSDKRNFLKERESEMELKRISR